MKKDDLLNKSLVVMVSGPPASGKTTMALELSARLGLPLVSRDAIKFSLIRTQRPSEATGAPRWANRFAGHRCV